MAIPPHPTLTAPLSSTLISTSSFWGERLACIRTQTVPAILSNLRTTGRIAALKWRPGDPPIPAHPFWDSDIYKMVEACCYLLIQGDDTAMREYVEEAVGTIEHAQGEDGYINSFITQKQPLTRFTNLRDLHELYQLGHLCEAAVAYQLLTTSTRLVDVAMNYINLVSSHFGPGPGKKRGYPGHQEVEIGLLRLYQLTSSPLCLDLARFFILERGTQDADGKTFFDREMEARGGDPRAYLSGEFRPHYRFPNDYAYHQAHIPLREQQTVEGHCVRAMYYLTAAAMLACETGDQQVLRDVERLFANATRRKMYVTGGLGSFDRSEGFAEDYWLPDQAEGGCAYAETCASFALIVLCHCLLQVELKGEYGDVIERSLYNAVLGAVSADGKGFFYENPLTVLKGSGEKRERSSWFDVACCPPNVVKLFGLLRGMIWSQSKDKEMIAVHLHISASWSAVVGGNEVHFDMESGFPWEGNVVIRVRTTKQTRLSLAVRVPQWARNTPIPEGVLTDGYLYLPSKEYSGTVTVYFNFPCTPRKIFAHPLTRKDEVCIARGPLIYCAENIDNPDIDIEILGLRKDFQIKEASKSTVAGIENVPVLRTDGMLKDMTFWEETGELYSDEEVHVRWREKVPVVFVPWFLRCNRGGDGGMRVWLKRIC